MLEVFNSPAPDFSCERRESSTVTPQALSLFNSKNSYDRSLALAQRVCDESSGETGNRDRQAVQRLYELVLCREPQQEELERALQSWRSDTNFKRPGSLGAAPFSPLLLRLKPD